MRMKECPPELTEQHLQLFGTIVQWFSRYELLTQEATRSDTALHHALDPRA